MPSRRDVRNKVKRRDPLRKSPGRSAVRHGSAWMTRPSRGLHQSERLRRKIGVVAAIWGGGGKYWGEMP